MPSALGGAVPKVARKKPIHANNRQRDMHIYVHTYLIIPTYQKADRDRDRQRHTDGPGRMD